MPNYFTVKGTLNQNNIELCSEISRKVSQIRHSGVTFAFEWVPAAAHEGIPQNEMADRLAVKAGCRVGDVSPMQNQPILPQSVSCSFVKHAVSQIRQQRWMNVMTESQGRDHLTQVQLSPSIVSRFFLGDRFCQTRFYFEQLLMLIQNVLDAKNRKQCDKLNLHIPLFYL